MVENVITKYKDYTPYFYRSASGNEMDLVLEKRQECIAIECKASSAPIILTKGFWNALEAIRSTKTFIIVPIETHYELKKEHQGNRYKFTIKLQFSTLPPRFRARERVGKCSTHRVTQSTP
ncbi:MAG: hypothetical protein QM751_11215 [Paludibacteraceae bacterium]